MRFLSLYYPHLSERKKKKLTAPHPKTFGKKKMAKKTIKERLEEHKSKKKKKPSKRDNKKLKQLVAWRRGREERGVTNPYGNGYWRPGVSANPGGKPKYAKMLTDRMKNHLDCLAESVPMMREFAVAMKMDLVTATVADVITANLLLEGMRSGNAGFVKEIFNRIEGKVADKLEIHTPSERADQIRELLEQMKARGGPVNASDTGKTNGTR